VKHIPFTRHWLIISTVLLLTLSACVRPVPRDTTPEAPAVAPTNDVLIIPTEPPATAVPDNGAATDNTGSPTTEAVPAATTVPEAPATPDAQATIAAGGEVTHVVKSGETLGYIAQLYNVSIDEIAAANGITDVNSLEVGQVLTINTGAAASAPAATSEPPAGNGSGEQVHVVQAGENLFRIGLHYGFTAEELAAYNNIPDPTRIEVGQIIKIPPK